LALLHYNRRCMNPFQVMADVLNAVAQWPAAVLIGIGVPMLLLGAEWLVRGSVALAQRMGVSTLIIGLTIVAAGTSAPELVINVLAALAGNPGLSFGNVIGSNIANIGLIVGIGALITPMAVNSRIVRSELPWLIIITAAMVILAIPVGVIGLKDGYGRVEGGIMILGFITLLVFWYRTIKQKDDSVITKEIVEKAAEQSPHSIAGAIGLFLAGLVLLLAGGNFCENGAVKIASYFGMSHAVIGMSVLAISTSLPELITVIIACRRGHTDLAVGNIVGSNLFNILLVMGVTSTIAYVPVPGIQGWQDLIAMMAFSMLLWWFCVTHKRKVLRWEGCVLLSLYVAYLGWSITRETLINGSS
jgi:cation:H+ antiporter